VFYNLAE